MGKSKIDWDSLDWTKTNWQLAFITGQARNSISNKRKQLGKPASTEKPVKWMPFRNHTKKAA